MCVGMPEWCEVEEGKAGREVRPESQRGRGYASNMSVIAGSRGCAKSMVQRRSGQIEHRLQQLV